MRSVLPGATKAGPVTEAIGEKEMTATDGATAMIEITGVATDPGLETGETINIDLGRGSASGCVTTIGSTLARETAMTEARAEIGATEASRETMDDRLGIEMKNRQIMEKVCHGPGNLHFMERTWR